MTQSRLAKRLDVSRDVVANIESGRQKVHVHQLVEIANALSARSVETLLPANLWVKANSTVTDEFEVTGSELSAEQRRQVASILDVLGADDHE